MGERSERLRRETEQTRAQVAETLEELRTRITPGQVVDQLVDYAGDSGAGEFFRNLGRQAVNNPLPVTLMGAGLAWLMLSGKSGDSRIAQRGRGLAREAGDGLGHLGAAARETSSELKNKASQWASQSAESVRSAAESAAEKGKALGSSMAERFRETTADWRESGSRMSDQATAR